MQLGDISTTRAPSGVRTLASVLAAAVAGLPLALVATSSTPASAAPAPITIAYISSLTGPGGCPGRQLAVRIPGAHRHAERRGRRARAQAGAARPRRPDEPRQHLHRGAGGRLQGLRHRLAEPAVLPGVQVPEPGRRPGHWFLRRRPRVGDGAQHEHVRLRRGQRRSQVPRQHPDRRFPQGARRDRARHLRLRHLAVLEPGRHRDRPTPSSMPAARPAS